MPFLIAVRYSCETCMKWAWTARNDVLSQAACVQLCALGHVPVNKLQCNVDISHSHVNDRKIKETDRAIHFKWSKWYAHILLEGTPNASFRCVCQPQSWYYSNFDSRDTWSLSFGEISACLYRSASSNISEPLGVDHKYLGSAEWASKYTAPTSAD